MSYGLTHYKVFLLSLVSASLLKLESYGEKLKRVKRKEATKGTKQKTDKARGKPRRLKTDQLNSI